MALLLALLLVLLSLTPSAAFATFPGRNGDLVVTVNHQSHPNNGVSLWRFNPRSGRLLDNPICQEIAPPWEAPPCFRAGPASVSPDGRSVAVVTHDVPYGYPNFAPYRRESSIRVLSPTTETWSQLHLPGWSPVPYTQPIVRWTPGPNFLVVVALSPIDGPEPVEPPPAQAVLVGSDGSVRGPLISDLSAPDVAGNGRVAFVRAGDVQVLDPGGAIRRVTYRGGDQPSWSPHGRLVAFTRKGYVYVVPATGGRARRVTRGWEPTWSPDGKRMAFFRTGKDPAAGAGEADVTYLYVLNRRTGRVHRVSYEMLAAEGVYANATYGLDWQVAR
jgi:hypothetical protein